MWSGNWADTCYFPDLINEIESKQSFPGRARISLNFSKKEQQVAGGWRSDLLQFSFCVPVGCVEHSVLDFPHYGTDQQPRTKCDPNEWWTLFRSTVESVRIELIGTLR